MSLAQIQEAPDRGVILLTGSPGAGKSAFCQQMVLNALALERPVIYATTEHAAADVLELLKERGLGEPALPTLRFVDASRVYESRECWGFDNGGAAIGSVFPPLFAGGCQALEKDEREWNAIETKCIGLGDPYCELKVVPGEIPGLKASLEKDSALVERLDNNLIHLLMVF